MTVVLSGWYETEDGVCMVGAEGDTLIDCIRLCIRDDMDFGHTDMELELTEDGETKDVTSLVYRLITCYE